MAEAPVVSVILPVFNSAKYLAAAISSIQSQTYKNWELLLLYDPSMDESLSICREFAKNDSRIKVIENQSGIGLSRCLNLGIEKAAGTYVARMDSDDVSLPERLSAQVTVMEKNPDVVIMGCDIEIIDETDNTVGQRAYCTDDKVMRRRIYYFSPFCHPAVIFRKSALTKIGGYDPSYKFGEDYDLYFRLGAVGKFGNLAQVLFRYRIVSSSVSHSKTVDVELTTIAIREKYRQSPGFKMSPLAAVYNMAHRFSIYFISPAFRTKLFYFLRNRKPARTLK